MMKMTNMTKLRLARQFSTFRVGIVGTGPAAFYTCKYLLSEFQDITVDMFDALPTPFGLVRFGVAPDHPEVKLVQNDFAKVAEDTRCRFLGNVEFGKDVSLKDLRSWYHSVVLAYGASADRSLNIPGEKLENVFSARTFVNWYNGHPSYSHLTFPLDKVEDVVVVGQGNVAVDVARILCAGVDELGRTDIATHALEALKKSTVKRVSMVGRRGPAQVAFTIKEFRELTKLNNVAVHIAKDDMASSPAIEEELAKDRPTRRKWDLMTKVAEEAAATPPPSSHKKLDVRFFLSPKAFVGANNTVEGVEFAKTRLEGAAGSQKAVELPEKITLPAGLVFKSVGYKSVPAEGVPFDTFRAIVPNFQGRVNDEKETAMPGLYVSGWLKRGPEGIIGSNIADARETVRSIVTDFKERQPSLESKSEDVPATLTARGVQVIDNEGWRRISEVETRRGESKGKPREKIVTREELIKAATGVVKV